MMWGSQQKQNEKHQRFWCHHGWHWKHGDTRCHALHQWAEREMKPIYVILSIGSWDLLSLAVLSYFYQDMWVQRRFDIEEISWQEPGQGHNTRQRKAKYSVEIPKVCAKSVSHDSNANSHQLMAKLPAFVSVSLPYWMLPWVQVHEAREEF